MGLKPNYTGNRMLKYKRANGLLKLVSEKHDVDIKSMRDPSQKVKFVLARREFCELAHAAGCGSVVIGKVLWRDPTTVLYHLRPDMREHRKNQRIQQCTTPISAPIGATVSPLLQSDSALTSPTS